MSQDSRGDPVLAALVAEAAADPETLGLLLSGSRGAGSADEHSDYDIVWVLTDAAYGRRGEPELVRRRDAGQPPVDLIYTCPANLARLAAEPSWQTFGYATARVLLDRTGELARALDLIATMPEEKARADAPAWFGAYLNAFYRSLKAWHRGDELGARLQAAESAMHLVRAL